jgi:hypothetical protein
MLCSKNKESGQERITIKLCFQICFDVIRDVQHTSIVIETHHGSQFALVSQKYCLVVVLKQFWNKIPYKAMSNV